MGLTAVGKRHSPAWAEGTCGRLMMCGDVNPIPKPYKSQISPSPPEYNVILLFIQLGVKLGGCMVILF